MRKYLSKVLCIMLGACLLFGCGGGKAPEESGVRAEFPENNSGNGSSLEGEADGTPQGNLTDNTQPGNPADGAQQGNPADGTQPGSPADNAQQGNLAGTTPDSADIPQDASSTGSITENAPSFPMLENYRERGIAFHADVEGRGENYCSILQNAEGKIEYFTVDPLKSNAGTLIWKYTLSSDASSWNKEPVSWTEGIKGKLSQGRITILLGEDKNYYAYYFDEEQQCHFVKQVGDSYEEIVIPDWDITVEGNIHVIPGRVCVAENGNIIMADQSNKCFIYSPQDGRELDRIRCGWYDSMCVSGNELFLRDYDTGAILHYDVQEMKALPPIEGNFKDLVRLAVSGDDLYASSPEGIFQAKKDGGSFQKILEPGKFYFSKENGGPLHLFMLGDMFCIFYAEQKGLLKKYAPRDPDEEFLGEITVYSLENNELVLDVIAAFQMEHPEIEVLYETGEGAEGSTTASDRIRALNARILAGEGPDVLILDGLPEQSYVEKGILADISAALSEEMGNITPNILEVYREQDALYMLPMRFIIPMFLTSGQDAAVFDSFETLVTWCEAAAVPALPAGLPYSYLVELLYYNFPPKLLAADGSVDREEIEEFLGLVKRFCDVHDAVAATEAAKERYPFSVAAGYLFGEAIHTMPFMLKEQSLIFVNMADNLMYYPDMARQRGGELLTNHGMFFANGLLGINARSGQKNLAEIFVKEAFSYEIQKNNTYRGGFSVHKKVLEEAAERDYSHIELSSGKDAPGDLYELSGFTKEEARQMIESAKTVNTPVERNQIILDIMKEEACSFLSGGKSKEAAAQEIANRLSLYYYE